MWTLIPVTVKEATIWIEPDHRILANLFQIPGEFVAWLILNNFKRPFFFNIYMVVGHHPHHPSYPSTNFLFKKGAGGLDLATPRTTQPNTMWGGRP